MISKFQNTWLFGIIMILIMLIVLPSCDPDNVAKPNQSEAFVKYYGGVLSQQGTDVRVTSDNGYILFGSTSSFSNGKHDFYLVKTDNEGNEEWSQTYRANNPQDSVDFGRVVRPTLDGGYILLGNTIWNTVNKILIVKTDASGNEQWQTVIRSSLNSNEFAGDIQVVPTSGGGYVLCGSTDDVDTSKPGYTAMDDILDLYTAKLNADGVVEWERIDGFPRADFGRSIEVFDNNTSIVTFGTGTLTDPEVKKSFLMAKYNFAGGPPFDQKNYGSVMQELDLANSYQTSDGGMVLVGTLKSDNNDNLVVFQKLDQALNAAGDLGLSANSISGSGVSIVETEEGNYAITATRSLLVANVEVSKIVLLISDPSGTTISDESVFGESGFSVSGNLVNLGTNGFIVSGTIDVGTNTMGALIKTNSRGQILPE